MTMRVVSLIAAMLLLSPPASTQPASDQQGTEPAEVQTPVRAKRLAIGEQLSGFRLVQADEKGRAFVLSETLELFPVDRHGELADPATLEPLAGFPLTPIISAAMCADGSWVVHCLGAPKVRLFRRGKERAIPKPGWMVVAVGCGDAPIISIAPAAAGQSLTERPPREPPTLLRLAGDRWVPMRHEPPGVDLDDDLIGQLRLAHDTVMAAGDEETFWIADRFRYRLRQLSSSGRLLTRIQVGDGEIVSRERSEEEIERLHELMAETGMPIEKPSDEGVRVQIAAKAEKAIQAIAIDGSRLYLLVPATAVDDSRPQLQRYDPVLGTLEAVPLAIPAHTGRRSMAAADSGLLIADYRGPGFWSIPWLRLDEADWRPVEGVRIGAGGDE